MKEFIEISPKEAKLEPISEIGSDWMLITAAKKDGTFNTMTAAWGGIGYLFNKPVAFCFIRPQRYTKEFTEESDYATLSFFSEKYRDALVFCGRNSGRDVDKMKETGLSPRKFGESVGFEEAKRVLLLKKLYKSALTSENFVDKEVENRVYENKDYHDVYIYEILNVYEEQK